MQVERLHEKVKAQGLQSAAQFDRSTEQFRSPQMQVLGHGVVNPSQVTDPRWPTEQFWSVAEQLVVLLLPLQLMVPPVPQFAEAVQRAFPRAGRFAAGVGATGIARAARKAWSAALTAGAAIPGDGVEPRAARTSRNPRATFFITDLLSNQKIHS
ncbi:MAG: hypothetical protein ABIS20_08770 [Thermoanaerobaculia bacterium]